MVKILYILQKITENHLIVISIAFFVGIVYAEQMMSIAHLSTFFLAIIFFLSSLKINFSKIREHLDDKWMLFVVNIFTLLVLPVVVYYIASAIYPPIALALLLLAAMPAGMTTPLLAEICGGKQSLALVLTITTSLLAPITVPLIVKLVAGSYIDVSFIDMFKTLVLVIYIPFIVAQIVKMFWQKNIDRVSSVFKTMSTIFLCLLISSIVAKHSDVIVVSLGGGGDVFIYLAVLFFFFLVLHFLGYLAVFWREKRDRVTIAVCLTYMNFTLAIELASKFFPEPNILIPVVLSVIPWALMIVPCKIAIRRLHMV